MAVAGEPDGQPTSDELVASEMEMSRVLATIVGVLYAVVLGAFLFDGEGRELVLDPARWPGSTWALGLTLVALVWSYMGYSFHLVRHRYRVYWKPLDATSLVERKKEQREVNDTGTENWRFVLDLLVPVVYGVMVLQALGEDVKAREHVISELRFGVFLAGFLVVRVLTMASAALRSLKWRTPVFRRFSPREVEGGSIRRAPWGDWLSLVAPLLVVLTYAWLAAFCELDGWDHYGFLGAATAVVIVQIVLDRGLARANFEAPSQGDPDGSADRSDPTT
jgi:hypothetical protein